MTTENEDITAGNPNPLVAQAGRLFFRYRNTVFPLIFAAIILLAKPSLATSYPQLDRFVTFFGVTLAAIGQAFRLFVIGFAYIDRGGQKGKVYASKLVTTGLYAHSRNPMYFGNGLIAIGFSLALGSIPACLIVIPFFIFVYYSIVVVEETFLRKQFGADYLAYEAAVPRFIPNPRGLQSTLSQFTFDWRKSIRKEYGTLFGTLVGIVFTFFFKDIFRSANTFSFKLLAQSQFPIWAAFLLAGYLTARTLKKLKVL